MIDLEIAECDREIGRGRWEMFGLDVAAVAFLALWAHAFGFGPAFGIGLGYMIVHHQFEHGLFWRVRS